MLNTSAIVPPLPLFAHHVQTKIHDEDTKTIEENVDSLYSIFANPCSPALPSMDPTFPAYPIFALLSFFLVLIPLPWHLQAWNSGTCLYMVWVAAGCLNQFVNSIVWHNNAIDWAPLWCDISTRLMVGIAVAIPSASLCINRRLYTIATCQTANITHAHKRRAVMIDLCIGLGIPALQMVLQFVVQGHRYDIWEDVGCFPTTVNTPPAYPLSFLWPNIISFVSMVYSVLTLKAFMARRAQFGQFLSSNSSLSVNHYFRLMCLATSEIFFTIPISTYGLYLNISSKPFYKWVSWSDTHFDFFTIQQIPAVLWRSNPTVIVALELNRWSLILCALVFFAFFGFAEESRRNYRRLYWSIAKRFGLVPPSTHKKAQINHIALPLKNSASTLPIFVKDKTDSLALSSSSRQSCHSVVSLADDQSTYDVDTLCSPPTPKAETQCTPSVKNLDPHVFPTTPSSFRSSYSTV